MKGVITIFAMPQEVEDLAMTLERLKRNSIFLDKNINMVLDITMCLSDELTNWEESVLTRKYIEDRTSEIVEKYADWFTEKHLTFELSNHTLGCVSQRRHSMEFHTDADFFIWLDCDMFFPDTILKYMIDSYNMVCKDTPLCIISPEFIRQWDSTWDVIVADKHKSLPIDSYKNSDIYTYSLEPTDVVAIKPINDFKFAGGWFTLISNDLLKVIGIPESFGHYGLEDTFIMMCSYYMKKNNINVRQYLLQNIIAGELHKHRTNETIKRNIESISRKSEFLKVAQTAFNTEFVLFSKKLIKST